MWKAEDIAHLAVAISTAHAVAHGAGAHDEPVPAPHNCVREAIDLLHLALNERDAAREEWLAQNRR